MEASFVVDIQNRYVTANDITFHIHAQSRFLQQQFGFSSSEWGRDWLTVQHNSTLTHGAFVASLPVLHGPEQCFLVQSKTMFQQTSDTLATAHLQLSR